MPIIWKHETCSGLREKSPYICMYVHTMYKMYYIRTNGRAT